MSALFTLSLHDREAPGREYGLILRNRHGRIAGALDVALMIEAIHQRLGALAKQHKVLLLSERPGRRGDNTERWVDLMDDAEQSHTTTQSCITEQAALPKSAVCQVSVQPAFTLTPTKGHGEQRQDDWHCYHVLLVERKDGIAYRLAGGWIYRDALTLSFSPGPTWTEIVLG